MTWIWVIVFHLLRVTLFKLFRIDLRMKVIDCFWLDFGVGDRVADFVRGLWPAISPGGFVLCHSSVTNRGTFDNGWMRAAGRA